MILQLSVPEFYEFITRGQSIIDRINQLEKRIMATLSDLQAEVESETTVISSVVTLLDGLKSKLDAAIAAGADPAKLQALSDQIGTNTTALSEAVARNTAAAAEAPPA